MASDTMEYVMENNRELEDLEVTEIDAAQLRDLLEELENEEIIMNKNIDTKENCLVQSAVDETEANNYDVFDMEQPHEFSDFSWVEMMDTSSLPLRSDDMEVPDWYAGADVVGMVGFEYCNNIGDYSYLYNETTYCCLWEEDS